MATCPVCGAELKEWEDIFYDQHILMESETTCPNDDYSEEYHHGEYLVYVRGNAFRWYYTTPDAEVQLIQSAIDLLIEGYKKLKETKNE